MHIRNLSLILVMVLIINISLLSGISGANYKVELGDLIPIDDYAQARFKPYSGYYTICEYDKSAIPIFITNFENAKRDYLLGLDSEKWALLPNSVTVNAGQGNLMFLSLFPPEGSAGTYVFELILVNEKVGTRIRRDIPLLVEKCYLMDIIMESLKSVCPCEYYSDNLRLLNHGTRNFTVNLSITAPDWLSSDMDSIYLVKGEDTSVGISGGVPCNLSLMPAIEINANIPKTNFRASKTLMLKSPDNCEDGVIQGNDSYVIDEKIQKRESIFSEEFVNNFYSSIRYADDFVNFYKYYFLTGILLILIGLSAIAVYRGGHNNL